MTNILIDRIQNSHLTKTQQKIANYFVRNQRRLGSLSSMEVAKEIGVSDASIIRFSRAIGYEGFADLKADIYKTLVADADSGLSLTERMNLSAEKYPDTEIASQFLNLMQQNLLYSFKQNDIEKYEQIADNIIHAKNRFIIGLRGCRGIAVQFSRLLSFMLPNVYCIADSECTSISTIQDAQKGDVVVMFVFSRTYHIDISYLKLARARETKVCLITNELNEKLISHADIILLAETEHMSFFHSALGASLIAEYLLTLVSRKVDCRERIQERDEITENQRL